MTQNVHWCLTRVSFITIFLSFTCNDSGSTDGTGTDYPSWAPVFVQSLVFCVVFCLSWFVFLALSLFFSPLCCLYFVNLVVLIIPLESSNFVSICHVIIWLLGQWHVYSCEIKHKHSRCSYRMAVKRYKQYINLVHAFE